MIAGDDLTGGHHLGGNVGDVPLQAHSLIGRRNDAPVYGEIEADAWLRWLRDMPDHVANVSRVAVLRAWSPGDDDVARSRARGIGIGDLSESVLRHFRDDTLLTIDYPRVV